MHDAAKNGEPKQVLQSICKTLESGAVSTIQANSWGGFFADWRSKKNFGDAEKAVKDISSLLLTVKT